MPRDARRFALSMGLLLGCFTTAALAQLPPPPPPPVTLWSFLGIPQGYRYVRDNAFNRSGNSPGMERKPPLKAIADPKNLQSSDPSIKKAAEVKQAEDLKLQKIKAVKYLASIGCGCYNRDGSITDALIKSLDDCTEEVRLATAQAIAEAAAGESCINCKMRSCCSEEISNKLYEIAYERDENGCFLEPSERVRLAAAEALRTCCSGNSDLIFAEPAPAPTPAPPNVGERPGEVPEAAGERPGIVPPVIIDPIPPAAPLPNPPGAIPPPAAVPVPVPVPVPVIPPPAGPREPAPAAIDHKGTSRRTAMLKAQPARSVKPIENSIVVKHPLPPISDPAHDQPNPAGEQASIRVMPHWTPAIQQTVHFPDAARGPFPIDMPVIRPTPDTVVVASLPDRKHITVMQSERFDETLGLAPVVSPESVKRPAPLAQLIPSKVTPSGGAPVVLPASTPKPARARPSAIEPIQETAPPVLTSDVSLDQPAKPARTKPAAPRRLPGAQFGSGTVTSVRVKDGQAMIEFNTQASIPVGSLLRAYHQYALVAKKAVCDLQVVESENGKAIVVARSGQLSDLSIGDSAIVLQ